MKVREFINRLLELDPDSNIWLNYDTGYPITEPEYVITSY